MWSEQDFINLEQEERKLTDEAILAILLLIGNMKGNLEKELRDFYSKYGKDGIVTYNEARKWISKQNRQRRLTALTILVSDTFIKGLVDIATQFRRFLTDVIGKESTFFNVKNLDVEKILFRSWGVDDSTWLMRLEKDVNLWAASATMDIKRAMLQKKNIDDVIKQVDKRFESIGKALENLGITESTAVGSLARQDIFKELGVTKYQIYTKDDERRCDTCGSMHGLIFPITAYEVGSTASPFHSRCRCWEVPIVG